MCSKELSSDEEVAALNSDIHFLPHSVVFAASKFYSMQKGGSGADPGGVEWVAPLP